MTPTHVKTKSLSGTIFCTVLAFTAVVIIVLGGVITSLSYFADEQRAEQRLAERVVHAAELLADVPSADLSSLLEAQFDDEVRCTLVGADGEVLYDSAVDAATLGNHASRPEIATARSSDGAASTSRYSETLHTDTLYAAAAVDDELVIRLSEERRSFVAFLGDMIVPLVAVLVAAIAVVFGLSRMLTKRIMKPIDALDFSRPLENEIYEEMDPLLVRIDEQQRQLVQQNKELAVAESMRRDFSSNVSHEMKTPLQVISGYAELMKNDMIDPVDRQRFAELIYSEAQSMRSLINDVLTLSRLDETAFGEGTDVIDVLALAERVKGRISSFAAEQGVSVRVAGEQVFIAGNSTLAEEMIYNLVENGIRYNHAGGSVTVEVQRTSERMLATADRGMSPQQAKLLRKAAVGESVAAQRLVRIRVRDTGPGIPEALRDKVFERFFRLEKSRSKETGGTGLGLAIVKHAVIYHGGTITIEDAEGGGTVFVALLPEYDSPSAGDGDVRKEEPRESEIRP